MSTPYNQYKGLAALSTDNEDDDSPPQFTTLPHEEEKSRWSHIDDLDEFFTRVYQYHQNHGMPTLVFMELLNLFQILFLSFFSIFMLECIDYTVLFQNQKVINDKQNHTVVKKKTLGDVVLPLAQCTQRITLGLWLVIIIIGVFWAFRLIKAIYNIARYAEIRAFYISALNIPTKDLQNITWNEVQEKLLKMQPKLHLCIHKQKISELDIYHRILRFKNYQVAMVNQGLLPPRITVPVFGKFMKKYILIFGVLNLLLAPVIFIWQLLQFVYNYTELIKRDPGVLGVRRWSNYGRLYFRHFNELEHELEARLSRAYRPALNYLSSFVSKFLIVMAKFVLFTFGAVFAALIILTVIDEDVLNVEHVFTIISITGAVAGIARSLIPDENAVFFMDQMMHQILVQVHYMPDTWISHANSLLVRDEFVKLFQFKFVYFIEELLSPLVTPFVLLFWLRPRACEVVDFLRNFTVEVEGVGDVCSFAQMDTRRHGNPKWLSRTDNKKKYQAKNGKTELSLIHFTYTNPKWKMPSESVAFFDHLKDQAMKETGMIKEENLTSSLSNGMNNSGQNQNSLSKSFYQLQSLVYNNTAPSSNLMKSNLQQQIPDLYAQQQSSYLLTRGAVNRVEGPLFQAKNEKQTLLSIAQVSALQLSSNTLLPVPTQGITTALENSLDMCFSVLYMHELHRKYHHGDYIDLDHVKEEASEACNEEEMGTYQQNNSYAMKKQHKRKRRVKRKSRNYEEIKNFVEQESDDEEDDGEGGEDDDEDRKSNKNSYLPHVHQQQQQLQHSQQSPSSTTIEL